MTTPTGKLTWGQAGVYDAIDDRSVIAAVTGNRTGLVGGAAVTAGSGLNLVVTGGWLGVAPCGDSTSAVVGSRTDQTVTGLPGPATGSRVDYVWCDVQPDSGTWSLSVINATAAAGRSGIALATLTVPANATLASQFTIAPGGATLERRLVGYAQLTETNTRTANTWTTAVDLVAASVMTYPGRWYRVKFVANSAASVTGGPDLRLAVGVAPDGSPASSGVIQKVMAIPVPALNRPFGQFAEWVFQWPVTSPPTVRRYSGRMWITGSGSYRTCLITDQGQALVLTVEDIGT